VRAKEIHHLHPYSPKVTSSVRELRLWRSHLRVALQRLHILNMTGCGSGGERGLLGHGEEAL
jgi:hypothetical protein